MKELEETVEDTTKDYNDQVHSLTKTAIDNVLAAVAVIVGSFLAAMFKSPFQEDAFRSAQRSTPRTCCSSRC